MFATKIGENTTSILSPAFHDKFILQHIKITIQKNEFTSHKHYLFWYYLLLKSRENSYKPSILQFFFTLSEKKRLTNLQNWQLQKPFDVHVIVTTCFDNWKTWFFINRYPEALFNHHVLVLFETSDLKEARFLYLYLQ